MIDPRATTRAALVLTFLPAALGAQDGPPGLVPLDGGRVTLGTDPDVVEELILENEGWANALVGETPEMKVKVDDFLLMPTEVTNEQYEVFVQISGIKPPHSWADADALAEARTAFLEEQGKAVAEARERGERMETTKFDAKKWWSGAWQETPWSLPEDLAEHPATFVDYEAAVAYATWAGLRLPTEAEWVYAARGETDDVFPWGDDWDTEQVANTNAQPYAETRQVGLFVDGAREGILDLSGNVWEWTDTPYTAFEGYTHISVKVSRNRTIEALANWEPSFRVLKGGSFANPLLAARVSTRAPALKSQSTEALGFRCAASTTPGQDAAAAVLAEDVTMSAMPAGVSFVPGRATILHRWESEPGKVGERIDGYRVITAYERILFMPVEKIDEGTTKHLDTLSLEEPVVFGLVSTAVPTMAPELNAGTYVVAYRAAGDVPDAETGEEEQPPGETAQARPAEPTTLRYTETPGFDPAVSQYLFFDGKGNPVASMPALEPDFEKLEAGQVAYEAYEPPKRVDPDNPPVEMDTIRFRAATGSKSQRKGFWFELPLGFATNRFDESWSSK